MSKYLAFGSSGALGAEISVRLEQDGHILTRVNRGAGINGSISLEDPNWPQLVRTFGPFDGVLWAQGLNGAGTVLNTEAAELSFMFEANVGFIAKTLSALFKAEALANPSRLVVLSSIWQDNARDNKFAYTVSKSALSGFVKSAAIDLAEFGIAINAVLPGVIDTPMTRRNLSPHQISKIEESSLGGKLATVDELYGSVSWLLSEKSAGLNGQFLTVDKGWSINRHV